MKFNITFYSTFSNRYTLNMTAAGFVLIGTLWDIGTWYYSKDVEIFDKSDDNENDDVEQIELSKNTTIKENIK
jgi:solute carrier organic anion transporter family, member 5A